MAGVDVRQVSILAVAVSMVVLGAVGLSGGVTPSPSLGGLLLVAAVVLAFVLGRWSTDFW